MAGLNVLMLASDRPELDLELVLRLSRDSPALRQIRRQLGHLRTEVPKLLLFALRDLATTSLFGDLRLEESTELVQLSLKLHLGARVALLVLALRVKLCRERINRRLEFRDLSQKRVAVGLELVKLLGEFICLLLFALDHVRVVCGCASHFGELFFELAGIFL